MRVYVYYIVLIPLTAMEQSDFLHWIKNNKLLTILVSGGNDHLSCLT